MEWGRGESDEVEGQGVVLYDTWGHQLPPVKQPDPSRDAIWQILETSSPLGRAQPKNYTALLEAYKSWVQICVSKVGMTLAMAKFTLHRESGGELGDPIQTHVFYDKLRRPNPYNRMTRLQFLLKTWVQWELSGNAYWWAPGGFGGRPAGLFILRPDRVMIQTEGLDYDGDLIEITGYKYQGYNRVISPDEMVHFKYPHPTHPVYGISRLSAQEYPYDIDTALGIHEYSFFKNRAVVDLIFAVKGMTRDQAEAYRTDYLKRHQGPAKSFEPTFIPADDVKVQQMSQTAKDAEVGELAKRVRDKILSAYDVPAAKVGLIKDVNRANGEFLDTVFARESLGPRAVMFCETLDSQLLYRYDRGLRCKLEIEVPKDREFELKRDQFDIDKGLLTVNEVNKRRGYPKQKWGDTWWKPYTILSVDAPAPAPITGGGKRRKGARVDREIRWKVFITRVSPLEKRMARTIRSFFRDQEAEILERLVEFGPKALDHFNGWGRAAVKNHLLKNMDLIDQILGDLGGYTDELAELFRPYEYEAYTKGGEAALEELGALDVDFDLAKVQGLEWVDWKVAESARKVNEATFRLLGDTLREGMVEGEDIAHLQERVQGVFSGTWRESRAASERIARTEVIGAANRGTLDGYSTAGVGRKAWLTAIDERTREDHIEADGQTVGIREPFYVMGEALEFPGDPNGSPENIINCRCTIEPILEQ